MATWGTWKMGAFPCCVLGTPRLGLNNSVAKLFYSFQVKICNINTKFAHRKKDIIYKSVRTTWFIQFYSNWSCKPAQYLVLQNYFNCFNCKLSLQSVGRFLVYSLYLNILFQYARGRFGNTWRRKTWVFGMLEIRGNSRRPVLRLVKRRNKATLVPIIKKHIKPQSTVVSDEWRAYSSLSQEGYRHVKVNHSQNYVDPATGLHTQNIERAWQTYKKEVWRLRGNRTEKSLKRQLCFIEWTYWLGKRHKHGILGRLFKDIRYSWMETHCRY